MPGGMGRGARGLDIDGEVVSLAKIVPKSDGGWKVKDRKVGGWWSGWE